MRHQRSGSVVIGATLLALAPGSAVAATKLKPPKLLKLSVHSSFAGNEPITVRWKTDRAMSKGQGYRVMLSTSGTPERDGPACSAPQLLVRRVGSGTPRGRTIVVRFPVPKTGRWCPSRSAGIDVDVDGRAENLGRVGFAIRDSRGLVPPQGYLWGRMTFAPASAITVKVPGRPDRTAPFTGQIDEDSYTDPKNPWGYIGESVWVNASGTVTPGALPADPLCTAADLAPLTVDRATTLLVPGVRTPTSPPVELTLVLRAGAAALTGCAPDGAAPAVAAALLKGDPNANGNAAWHVTGSIDGVRLAGGAVASIVFDLQLNPPTPPAPAQS